MTLEECLPVRDADLESTPVKSPSVVDLTSDRFPEIMRALSAKTAREILTTLVESAGNPAQIADDTGETISNTMYHLKALENAGLIGVVGTAYSVKGREMDLYAPTGRPILLVVGQNTVRDQLVEELGEEDA